MNANGTDLGRWLILAGAALVAAGVVVRLAPRLPWLGHLPGDITIRRGGFTLYIPLTTGLLLSLLVTLVARLWRR